MLVSRLCSQSYSGCPPQLCNTPVCAEQVVDEEATAKKRQEAEEAARSKGEDADKVEVDPVKKRESRMEWDWTVQNDNKPIWTRSPKEVHRSPS